MSQQITVPDRIQRAFRALDFAARRTWWGLPITAWTCKNVGDNWINFLVVVPKVGSVNLEYWEVGYGSTEISHVLFHPNALTCGNRHTRIDWGCGLLNGDHDYPTEVNRVSTGLHLLLAQVLPQIGILPPIGTYNSESLNLILGSRAPMVRADRMCPDGDVRSLQSVYEATIFFGDMFDGYLQAWITPDFSQVHRLEINRRPFTLRYRFQGNVLVDTQ